MDANTSIKTEPSTMTDDEFEVNIHGININGLLILVFVIYFIFGAIAGAP